MNRRDVTRQLAKRYPGGIDALAPRMGKRPDTLRKELTGVPGYKLGVDDEEEIIDLCIAAGVTDALAPLTAAALPRGALLVLLPQSVEPGGTTWNCLADATQKFGTLVQDYGAAVADGKVSDNELRRVQQDFAALVAIGQRALANLGHMHEASRPAALREVRAA